MKLDWLDPIFLELGEDDSEAALIKRLRAEIKGATTDRDLKQSVYVVRLMGRAVIAYDKEFSSPVVYVGRGDSVKRLASHLKNWASKAFTWGHDTSLEIRIIRPELKDADESFKNLEADLIRWFHDRAGMLPLINRQFEKSFEGKVSYREDDREKLKNMLGVGRGKRPHWAILPLASNPHYETYYKHW